MDTKNEELNKVEKFFEYDLKVKEILNEIMPVEFDFYDDYSRFKYAEKLLDGINRINMYVCKMMLDYNLPVDIISQFDKKIHMIDEKINSKEFYDLLKQGYNSTLKFVHTYISDIRIDFVDSVRKGFKGYYVRYGSGVLEPQTIHEYLHYVHSYVINKEDFYFSVPKIKSTSDRDWGGISLRGISNEIGNELYQKIIDFEIDSGCIDIINLDKHIIIMARDLGHAAVIEIDLSNKDAIFVKYFIPKNTNMKKMGLLRGIYTNNIKYAIGEFLTTRDNFVMDLCSFMQGIPTDYDMEWINFNVSR